VRRALLSLSLCALLAAAAVYLPAADADDLIDCLDRLEAFEIPLVEIYLSCPDLDKQVEATGWSASLPPGWRDEFTEVILYDLFRLTSAYSDQAVAGPMPQLGFLDKILTELGEDPEIHQTVSLWAEIKDWLKETMDRFFPGVWDSIREWFDGFAVSESVADSIGVAALALVGLALAALLAALIVYARRNYRPRKKTATSTASLAPRSARAGKISLEQIDAAPLSERPRLLLRYLLQELDRRHRLDDSARLTHRELTSATPFTAANEASAFERVVRLAELTTFGIWQPDRNEFSTVLTDGQLLLRSLDADRR